MRLQHFDLPVSEVSFIEKHGPMSSSAFNRGKGHA
jgi:hypothetical protein